jgi:hypothetical protein
VIARHDALRTRYLGEVGEPYAVIDPQGHCALRFVTADRPDPQREAAHLLETDAELPFDLATGPLLRALLVRVSGTRLVLGITLHHIAADGWSVGILSRELIAAYLALAKGSRPDLPETPFQYADFADWENSWIHSDAARGKIGYWHKRLSGMRAMDLPTDFQRPSVQTFREGRCTGELSPDLTRGLAELSRANGATPFMALLAAFGLLLHRLAGVDEVPIGVPVSGRERTGTEQLVGMFINMIVFRLDFSGDPSFAELLRSTRTQALEGYANAEAPFDLVVNALQVPRDAGRTPLFQVLVNSLDFRLGGRTSLPDVEIEPEVSQVAASKFDMTLYLGFEEHTVRLMLTYNSDLFAGTTITNLMSRLQALVAAVIARADERISSLALKSEVEQRAQAIRPERPFVEFEAATGDGTIPARFRAMVALHADRTAVECGAQSLTYRELDAAADLVARAVAAAAPGMGCQVGLLLEHNAGMVAAVLGTLLSGNAYVPLDPLYPRDRLAFMLRNSQVGVLLANGRNLSLARSLASDTVRVIDADELASTNFDPVSSSVQPTRWPTFSTHPGRQARPRE